MFMTKAYRNELAEWNRKGFGDSAGKWKYCVNELIRVFECGSILDYGCGQAVLKDHISKDIQYQGYDPASKKYCKEPKIADLTVCIDVLEHIEPNFLDNVISHVLGLTKKICFLNIAQRPATQILKDGRNAHLILEGPDWWLSRISYHAYRKFEVQRQFGMTIKKDLVFLLEKIDD